MKNLPNLTDNNDNNIELEQIVSEERDAETDTARYKINTYGADFTLELLSKKIEEKEIIIPLFQRRYVWSIKKASKLIESFLLGLPVPQIFLYRENDTQNLLVVDGQQRLKTINYFFKGIYNKDIVFKLAGVRKEWEGKTYSDLSSPEKRKLNNYILRANIFEQTDPQDDSSIYEIFERLNTGGVALNQQEVRNCVIRGPINDFIKELNEYKPWRLALGKEQPDARMKDIEMIVRYLALYKHRNIYKAPMKDFISKFMEDNKNLDSQSKARFKDIFTQSIDIVTRTINKPFRLKAGINIAVFDSVMVAISELGLSIEKNFKTNYHKLLIDQKYIDNVSIHTTDPDSIKKRIELALTYFSQ